MSTPQTRSRGKKTTPLSDIDAIEPSEEEAKEAARKKALKPEDFYQLFSKSGDLLFTSEVEKNKDFYRTTRDEHFKEHLPRILKAAMYANEDIDLSQLTLANTNLAGVDFRGMQLFGIDFSNCNFNQADLRNANMVNCNLSDCAFDGTRMENCDITGAILNDTSFAHVEARNVPGLIMLCDLDDYFLYAYPRRDTPGQPGELRIKAGCRDFSLADAREHWNEERTDRPEIRASLNFLEAVARNRGWITTNEDPGVEIVAGDGPQANPVDFDDEDEE